MSHPGPGEKGSPLCLGNGTEQFFAQLCFIDAGSVYCFIPPLKMILMSENERKMQLGQEVGDC